MDRTEFEELFKRISNWGRWPRVEGSPIGSMNLLTREKRREAVGLVKEGVLVSLSTSLDMERGSDNPHPAIHLMLEAGDSGTADFIGFAPHGWVDTHLDAVSHWSWQGRLFDDVPGELVDATGARTYSVDSYREGIVGRGVLLDIAHLRGVPWLDIHDVVMPDELSAAEEASGVVVGEGDLLFVRTGRDRRRREEGRADPADGEVGLHVSAATWLKERGVALMGSDSCHDAIPSSVEGEKFPLHTLAITGMGMPLLDNVELERLSMACQEYGRWEFLAVVAPLRVMGATGIAVNPLAVL